MQLRPYQAQAITAVLAARRAGIRRMVLALPTGAGKTVIFSELIARAKHQVLVLAHRDELVTQARAKIQAALRRLPGDDRSVAVEQGARRAPRTAAVIVASIRSLHGDRLGRVLAGRDVRLVIYDECHHAVADDNRRVLERLGVFEPQWPGTLVGLTATTRRGDGRGLDEVFERVVYERSLRQMIADGYLRPLRGIRIATGVDIAGVGTRDDDFAEDELAEAVDIESRNLLVARSIQELTRERRTLAFCSTVRHAEHLCGALNRIGVRAGFLSGAMPTSDRRRTLRRFREGRLQVLTNVAVLTEGFDDPGVSAIAMVRPTRSPSLYIQCIGRGMRPSPEADDCLVLDFVDLSRLSLVTTATLDADARSAGESSPAPDGPGAPPVAPVGDDSAEAPATLADIQARLLRFDPLVGTQLEESAAISNNAWLSLGARGMLLHFLDATGHLHAFEIRCEAPPRRGATVWLDNRYRARFPTTYAAIEAVDYELPNCGDPSTARPAAAWRQAPIDHETAARLAGLRPPRIASTVGEALAHLALSWIPPRRHRDCDDHTASS